MIDISKRGNKKISLVLVTLLCVSFLLTPTINAKISPSQLSSSANKAVIDEIAPVGDPIYDLLIISPKSFIDELQPLVCHKNTVGMSTQGLAFYLKKMFPQLMS